MLRNTVGDKRVSDFPEKSVTKMYGSTLLALQGGGWVSNFWGKKRYVTLEWPLTLLHLFLCPQPGGKLLASAKAAVPTISEHAHSMSVTGSAKNLAAALAELLTATTRAQEACGSLEIDGALYKVRQLERDLEEVRKTARGGNLMPLPGETVSNGVLMLHQLRVSQIIYSYSQQTQRFLSKWPNSEFNENKYIIMFI